MQHPFYHATDENVVPPAHKGSSGMVSIVSEVSYVQLLPAGWVWYRLVLMSDGRKELRLVQSSDPDFMFDTVRFSAEDTESEQRFEELGLLFVDAPPARTSEDERRIIAEALRDLVRLDRELRKAKEDEARRTGWLGSLSFFRGNPAVEKNNISYLEQQCSLARERFMDLCRHANEDESVAMPAEPEVSSGKTAEPVVGSDGVVEPAPSLKKHDDAEQQPSGKYDTALKDIIRQALQGVGDAGRIRENLKLLQTMTVGGLSAEEGLDGTVRKNVEAILDEAEELGITVTSELRVEKVFEALADLKQ